VADLIDVSSMGPHRPTYTLHPSFTVRRVVWRPGYQCEIALVSSTELATGCSDPSQPPPGSNNSGLLTRAGISSGLDSVLRGSSGGLDSIYAAKDKVIISEPKNLTLASGVGDSVEIWDVRREGGVSDLTFADSHAIWAQYGSGSFSQIDLRCYEAARCYTSRGRDMGSDRIVSIRC